MVAFQDDRRDAGDHGLSDAVVIGLDLVPRRRAGAANQPAGPQEGDDLILVGGQLGRPGRLRLADRPARDRDDLEEATCRLRQASDPRPKHIVQGHFIGPWDPVQEAGIGLDVPHELGDEERITPRLAGDRRGVGAGSPVAAAEEGPCQPLGLPGLQRA